MRQLFQIAKVSLLLLSAVICPNLWAKAESTVLQKSYWVDASGKASFETARQAEYLPYIGTLSKGYTKYPVWIRLSIAASNKDQSQVLRIRPAFLREVILYDPVNTSNGLVSPIKSGRATNIDSANFESIDLGFNLPPSPAIRYVYLQINTPTTLIADIDVLSKKDALVESKNLVLILLLYVGGLIAATIWGVTNLVVHREDLYASFIARQVFSTLYIIVFVGLYRYLFSESLGTEFGDTLYNLVVLILVFPVIYFDVQILREFQAPRLLRNIPLAFSCLFLVGLTLYFLGETRTALEFNAVISLLSMTTLLLPAFKANKIAGTPAGGFAIWLLRGGFTLTALTILSPILAFLNFINMPGIALGLITTQAGVSTIQLMLLLHIRSKRRELLHQTAIIENEISKSKLAQETKQRTEKESYLAMITHELRNPLSVIRLLSESSNHAKSIQRAAGDMQKVIDRVAQSESLANKSLVIKNSNIQISQLISDLLLRQNQRNRIKIRNDKSLMLASDSELITSILNNLLDNAIKYSPKDSLIELEIEQENFNQTLGIVFHIKNEVGDADFPDESKLFQKYYRSPGAHRQIGSGLGLYLVSQWAQALGGKILYQRLKITSQDVVQFSLWIPQ